MLDRVKTKDRIPKANSRAIAAQDVASDLSAQLGNQRFSALFFFVSGPYNINELGQLLSARYPDTQIFGCTSAGVIGVDGYADNAISAFALPRNKFTIESQLFCDISVINMSTRSAETKELVKRFHHAIGDRNRENSFALLLIDGLSMAEETVLSAVYPELGSIPLFGGSAGDDLKFQETSIYYNGNLHQNAAALILIHTECPFHVFRTEHFIETPRKMVITEADPASRIVNEINAAPAAEEYARLIGVKTEELNSTLFAAHPVMVKVGGSYYVRSIQRPEKQDGLRFFCAIDEGLVLTLAKGQDMVTNLLKTFIDVESHIGQPELIIGCDCIFRKLELEQTPQKKERVSELLKEYNVYGFNTYGEQFAGMHVNQTFTGVAIGWDEHDD